MDRKSTSKAQNMDRQVSYEVRGVDGIRSIRNSNGIVSQGRIMDFVPRNRGVSLTKKPLSLGSTAQEPERLRVETTKKTEVKIANSGGVAQVSSVKREIMGGNGGSSVTTINSVKRIENAQLKNGGSVAGERNVVRTVGGGARVSATKSNNRFGASTAMRNGAANLTSVAGRNGTGATKNVGVAVGMASSGARSSVAKSGGVGARVGSGDRGVSSITSRAGGATRMASGTGVGVSKNTSAGQLAKRATRQTEEDSDINYIRSVAADGSKSVFLSKKNDKEQKNKPKGSGVLKKSPFLMSVDVDKRPLGSAGGQGQNGSNEKRRIPRVMHFDEPRSYSMQEIKDEEKSAIPIWALIIITVVVGGLVGAGVFLIFFR